MATRANIVALDSGKKLLKNTDKREFKKFIDDLLKLGETTLSTAGNIAIKYGYKFENSTYENEIAKIPVGTERELFKVNFLTDNVLGAEARIMAWLYYDYFGDWYQHPYKNE